MSKANLLNTKTHNFQEVIGNGKLYQVPPYQRDYSWSEEQWEDLWIDIVDVWEKLDQVHYMGALVVQGQTDRNFLIIDGQQRLATLSVLGLAVIAKLERMASQGIDQEANKQRAKELRNRFIGEKDPASLIESSRLTLNQANNGFFQDYVVQLRKPQNPRRLPKSNRLLWDCFEYYSTKIDKLPQENLDGSRVAKIFSEAVARQLLFIFITVESELDAYTVFETLNARGLELTTTDLLKNYLFSLISNQADMEVLQRRWNSLIAIINQERFPEFLRYHLLCELPKIRSQELFKLIRKRVKSLADVFGLLDVLDSRAELFSAIFDPNDPYWTDLPKAKPYIAEINLFRVKQMTPLVFAAKERFGPEEFVRVLRTISVISFRFSVVSGLNTNLLEPAYHGAAKAILDGTAKAPTAVVAILKDIYVPDEKFVQDFAVLALDTAGQRRKIAKYILCRLEHDASGVPRDHETDPGTIEHILPENPAESWEELYEQSQWDADVYRVGNLTLLEAAANREIGNALFSEKLGKYQSSNYALTSGIPEIAPEVWNHALMEARQLDLAKRAKHVWRVDFT